MLGQNTDIVGGDRVHIDRPQDIVAPRLHLYVVRLDAVFPINQD